MWRPHPRAASRPSCSGSMKRSCTMSSSLHPRGLRRRSQCRLRRRLLCGWMRAAVAGHRRYLPGISIPIARRKCLELAAPERRRDADRSSRALRSSACEPGVQRDISEARAPAREGLLVMDCEGAEFDLLDPQAGDFRWLDLVVEVHPGRERTVRALAERFESTHASRSGRRGPWSRICRHGSTKLGHLDQLLARLGVESRLPLRWLVIALAM